MNIPPFKQRFTQNLNELSRWSKPGLGVKRWLFLVLLGITMLGVGLAILLSEIYRTNSTNPVLLTALTYLSLQFLPRVVRMFIFSGLGMGLVTYGILRINASLLRPFIRPGSTIVEQLANYRLRERGPRIVTV
ncbi:MAG TPA: hypothetical protein VKB96_14540, partial [Gammaproteobacteria bacterium]|nr:hypothetical protein [Gammaproteobacteria bacterium]